MYDLWIDQMLKDIENENKPPETDEKKKGSDLDVNSIADAVIAKLNGSQGKVKDEPPTEQEEPENDNESEE